MSKTLSIEGTSAWAAVEPALLRQAGAPQLRRALPLYRSERTLQRGALTSARRAAGVRLEFTQPPGMAEDGVRLGVVVARHPEAAERYTSGPHLRSLVCRWRAAAHDSKAPFGVQPVRAETIANRIDVVDVEPERYALSIVGVGVECDDERKPGHADIVLDPAALLFTGRSYSTLQLAPVHYRAGTRFRPEWGQVASAALTFAPPRIVKARRSSADALQVTLIGAFDLQASRLTASWHPRAGADALPEVGVDGAKPILWETSTGPMLHATLQAADFDCSAAAWADGRIVIEEWRPAPDSRGPHGELRAVWSDAFEVAQIGLPA